MKILFYLKDLSMGGVERRTLRLIEAILNNSTNISIDLVLNERKGELLAAIDDRVTIYSLNAHHVQKAFQIIKFGKLVLETSPDFILTGFGQLSIIAVTSKVFCKFKAKIILIQALPILLSGASSLVNQKRITGAKLFFPHLDKIVTVSEGIAKNINKISYNLNQKTITIYNPVVTPLIFQQANEDCYHPYFEDYSVVINVGRLTKEKDQSTLIKAFSIAKCKSNKKLKLIILGEGPERSKLEVLIDSLALNQDVSLPGFNNNPYAYMKKSSVFVLSSLWEGLPNVLIEAMALGVPVVSTNCETGPDEILRKGEIGELVPVGDENALAAAILKQLNTPDNRGVLKKRANDFTVEKAAFEYIKLFSSL